MICFNCGAPTITKYSPPPPKQTEVISQWCPMCNHEGYFVKVPVKIPRD